MHTRTHCLTISAQVDGAVLRYEKRLLQEAQDDDGHYPELEADQVTEGAEHHHDPGYTVDGIHRRHQAIELCKQGNKYGWTL